MYKQAQGPESERREEPQAPQMQNITAYVPQSGLNSKGLEVDDTQRHAAMPSKL